MSQADQGPAKVTVGDIAVLADVTPAAVSNWRRRHTDFPSPVDQTSTGDLFDLAEVTSWMEARGKEFRQPAVGPSDLLWAVADRLRGKLSHYESIDLLLQVMALAFYAEKQPDSKGDPEDADTLDGLQSWWRHAVREPTVEPEDGEELSDTISAGLRLLGMLRPELDRALGLEPPWADSIDFGTVTSSVELAMERQSACDLARGLLRGLEETVARKGAGYFSPETITRLQVRLLEPVVGKVYDPAAGTAMVLAECWQARGSEVVELFGQEVDQYLWRVGSLHLALCDSNFRLETGDTLRDDQFSDLRADRVAVDPPFGLKLSEMDLRRDERWSFGIPKQRADWLWAQVALHHLAEGGRAVMTAPLGALFNSEDAPIREAILRADVLDAVVELPPNLYHNAGIPVALLVFDRAREDREGRVLFVDARQLGEPRRGSTHELSASDLDEIFGAVDAWRAGEFEDVPRFAGSAEAGAISLNGFDLSPKRYVRYAVRVDEIDGEPLQKRLERLSSEVRARVGELAPAMEHFVPGVRSVAEAAENHHSVRLRELLAEPPKAGSRQDLEGENRERPFIDTLLVAEGSPLLATPPSSVTRGKTKGRLVRKGDVLLMSRGIDEDRPVGCAVVDFAGSAAYSHSLLRLRVDRAVVLPEYLMLYLTSRQGRSALAAVTTGSVIGNLRSSALEEVEVPLPSLDRQQEIVSNAREALSAYARIERLAGTMEAAFDTFREIAVAGGDSVDTLLEASAESAGGGS